MVSVQKRLKRTHEILSQLVLPLLPRVEVLAIIGQRIVKAPDFPGNARPQFFNPGNQPVESPLRFRQRPIWLRRQYQPASSQPIRRFIFE